MAILTWLGIVLLAIPALGQLHVLETKTCGETTCQEYEYCRDADLICSKCSTICDSKNHNFQLKACELQCQDYLHDQRYQRKGHSDGAGDFMGDNGDAKLIATVALILSLILCIIFITFGFFFLRNTNLSRLFKFTKDKKIPEKSRYPDDVQVSAMRRPNDTTVTIPTISEAVRNNNPAPPKTYTNLTTFKNPAPKRPEPETPPLTNSSTRTNPPLERRIPSEDSALDFAYDNPALTPSPVPNKANIVA